jgi:hypothetical protein
VNAPQPTLDASGVFETQDPVQIGDGLEIGKRNGRYALTRAGVYVTYLTYEQIWKMCNYTRKRTEPIISGLGPMLHPEGDD